MAKAKSAKQLPGSRRHKEEASFEAHFEAHFGASFQMGSNRDAEKRKP